MDMTLRKENAIRSIVTEEFDLMLFPEIVQGHLLGTYYDGDGELGFAVSPDLQRCFCESITPENKALVERITNLIELYRKNDSKEESWSKVIEG
ncbi:MAG: hypothetical protein HFJ26_00560 [Clostridia bacterium]|jgi:hypothetical protein|nr:hypothetical protein [Clostridia bacterium]